MSKLKLQINHFRGQKTMFYRDSRGELKSSSRHEHKQTKGGFRGQ